MEGRRQSKKWKEIEERKGGLKGWKEKGKEMNERKKRKVRRKKERNAKNGDSKK